jgi:hypothetical protein
MKAILTGEQNNFIPLGLILLQDAVGRMDYLSYQFEKCKNIWLRIKFCFI